MTVVNPVHGGSRWRIMGILAENRPEWPQNPANFEQNSSLLAANFTRIFAVGPWGREAMLKWFFNLFTFLPPFSQIDAAGYLYILAFRSPINLVYDAAGYFSIGCSTLCVIL